MTVTNHSETRAVPYSPQQMFDLVAAVDKYPEFLPWCGGARIRSRADKGDCEEMIADLIIAFQVFRERYGSRIRLYGADRRDPPRIEVENLDGLFQRLDTLYVFHPRIDGGCDMAFSVSFEFRSRILQRAGGLFFEQAMRRIVRAFEERAAALYGRR